MTVGELRKKINGVDDKVLVDIHYESDEGKVLILSATEARLERGFGDRGKDGRPTFKADSKGPMVLFFIDASDDIRS